MSREINFIYVIVPRVWVTHLKHNGPSCLVSYQIKTVLTNSSSANSLHKILCLQSYLSMTAGTSRIPSNDKLNERSEQAIINRDLHNSQTTQHMETRVQPQCTSILVKIKNIKHSSCSFTQEKSHPSSSTTQVQQIRSSSSSYLPIHFPLPPPFPHREYATLHLIFWTFCTFHFYCSHSISEQKWVLQFRPKKL